MRFEEALAELRKDPAYSIMRRPHYPPGDGYVIKGGQFLWREENGTTCDACPGQGFMACDWEIKQKYYSGVEAIEAYKQGKWISHVDWHGGFYNLTSNGGQGCLRYTGDILRLLTEDKWRIKDKI